jgi:thymidylate synthase
MYSPIYNRQQLILGSGENIIVTGWTPAKQVAASLDKRNIPYASVGNLYNAYYGLTPLIANLLYHAELFPIHILNCNKHDKLSNSSFALHQLLEGHYTKDDQRWVVLCPNGNPIGEVDKTIEQSDLESLQHSSTLWEDLTAFYTQLSSTPFVRLHKRSNPPRHYTFKEGSKKYNPGPTTSLSVEGDSIFSCWVSLLYYIHNQGVIEHNRKEVLTVVSTIHDEPADLSGIHPAMPLSKEATKQYCQQVLSKDSPATGSYTYGSRLRRAEADCNLDIEDQQYIDQLHEVAFNLASDPSTNRGVMITWIPKEDVHSEQPPCLTQLQVKVVDQKLIIIATFRSHDIYAAYCSNLFAIREIQQYMTNKVNELNESLNLRPGKLICVSQAAHVYNWSLPNVEDLLDKHYPPKTQTYDDPVGNFILAVYNNSLEIVHTTPRGRFVRRYSYPLKPQTNPLNICRELHKANPSILPTHLAYLGIEISRAISCFKDKKPYIQDTKG